MRPRLHLGSRCRIASPGRLEHRHHILPNGWQSLEGTWHGLQPRRRHMSSLPVLPARCALPPLQVEELSPEAQAVVRKYAGAPTAAALLGKYGPMSSLLGVQPWCTPSLDDWELLSQVGEWPGFTGAGLPCTPLGDSTPPATLLGHWELLSRLLEGLGAPSAPCSAWVGGCGAVLASRVGLMLGTHDRHAALQP